MRYVLSGKFLTSRMFIALSLLTLAVYMFSLAVKKKNGDFHLEEIQKLEELLEYVVDSPEKQKKVFTKINFKPMQFQEWQKQESKQELGFLVLDKQALDFMQTENWKMLSWMKSKTWLDVVQADFPKKFKASLPTPKELIVFFGLKDIDKKAQKHFLDKLQYHLFASLIAEPEKRFDTLKKHQELLGALYYVDPKFSLQHSKDIVALGWDLKKQKLISEESELIDNEDLKFLQIYQFLLESDMLLNFTQKEKFQWIRKSDFYCHYVDSNYRQLALVSQVGDAYVFSPDDGVEESFTMLVAKKKECGQYVKELSFEQFKAEILEAFDRKPPAGKWDINTLLENQNFFLRKIRENLIRRMATYQ
jgi:hypothetical protein